MLNLRLEPERPLFFSWIAQVKFPRRTCSSSGERRGQASTSRVAEAFFAKGSCQQRAAKRVRFEVFIEPGIKLVLKRLTEEPGPSNGCPGRDIIGQTMPVHVGSPKSRRVHAGLIVETYQYCNQVKLSVRQQAVMVRIASASWSRLSPLYK